VILFTLSLNALPQAIEGFIAKSTIAKKDMSIYIKEVGRQGRVIVSHNAAQSRTPASVIKVLSTYAAVLKLGFEYHFPTKFYITGSVRNGVLNGDLIVKGFGDPTLNRQSLKEIVDNIHARGIRKITGHIVIDRSYFRVGTKDSSGFDEHPYSPYNAMPDAMMYNERVSTICVTPSKNSISKRDADNSYKVINKLQAVNKPCKGRYSWPGVRIDKSKVLPTVSLIGKVSKHCGKQNICKVVTKPYLSFYYALKDRLKKGGIMVSGNMRLRKVPSHAKLLFTHYSKSLESIISKTAKKSNNLYARHLLLTLGAKMYGAPATLSKGRRAVENILKKHHALSQGMLRIDNGSGLSRTAKLSAKILVDMYDNAYERYGKRWMKTLSIAGIDGTIKKRFRGTIVKSKAWMKTGTLRRTKNISGYVQSSRGQLYSIAILVQSKRGNWRASQLQNEIIKWLVQYKGSKSLKPMPMEHKNSFHSSTMIDKKYYVQAGAFMHLPTKKYLHQIEKLGLPYKVHYTYKHKVLVGPYIKEEDVQNVLSKVRAHINPKAFVTKL